MQLVLRGAGVEFPGLRGSFHVFPFQVRIRREVLGKLTYRKEIIMAGKPKSLDILPPELKLTRGDVLVRPESAMVEAIEKRRGSRTLRETAKELGTSEGTLVALMKGRKLRRDAAVRVVVGLGLTQKVTFLAAEDAKPVEDRTAGKMTKALDVTSGLPTFELIAELHNEQPERGWLELYKDLWSIREGNRHREAMTYEILRGAGEQLRISNPDLLEEALLRIVDRILPRETL